MPTPSKILALTASCALLLALAGCGGDGGDEPAPPLPSAVAAGQARTLAVGSTGGSLVLTTGEGARFTLTVPPGAVPDGTLLGLETVAATARQRFQLRLSPAGLVPAEPLTLAVTLPAGLALPVGAALSYDGVPIAYTRAADGGITLRLVSFAGPPAATAAAGHARALSARSLAETPAHPCGSTPVPDFSSGTLAAGDPAEADLYGQCMLGAVQQLAADGEYTSAARLATALAAYLQKLGAANTDALSGRFADEARGIACSAYGEALDTAEATTVTSFGTLARTVRRVLFWEQAVQQLGAACAGIPPTRYIGIVERLADDAMRYFAGRRGAVVDVLGVEYTEAVQAVRDGQALPAQLRSLAAPPAVQSLATTQLRERALPAIVDAVLQAPWQRCRDSGNFDKLIELMTLGHAPAAVKAAAQYCATQLQARSLDAAGRTTATLAPPLGGVRAGEARSSGAITVARDGRLELSGPVRALQCPAGHAGGSETLEVRLGSTVLQTITTAPYLAVTLQIDIAEALRAAGIDAAGFTGATLTLARAGSPCGGFWGDNPAPLLTLELSSGVCAPAAGQRFCATPIEIPGSVDIGGHELLAINDAGELLYREYLTPTCNFSAAPENAPCAGVWRRGAVRLLPNRFHPVGISNDGTVAGNLYSGSAATAHLRPAVALPGRDSAIVLATPILQTNGDPPSGTGYLMDTISPNGRVTYHLVRGGYSYSGMDYGFCTGGSASSVPYCWKEQFFETSGPDYGAGTLVHQSQLPDGEGRTELYFDNDGQGRGGDLGPFFGSSYFASRNFGRGEAEVVLAMMDRSGATLVFDRNTGRRGLRSSAVALQPGYEPVMLGLGGHGLACDTTAATWQARLFDTGGGTVGEAFDAFFTVRIGDAEAEAEVSLPCNPSLRHLRLIDSQGRIVAVASSNARPRLRGVILTPAGVALP